MRGGTLFSIRHGVGPSPQPSPRKEIMEDFEMYCRGEGARAHATGMSARSLAETQVPLPAAEVAEEADVVRVPGFGM